jgi:hypothetical protein
MKTILCMGQSNAIGRGAGGVSATTNVTVWDNENDRTDTTNLGAAFVTPSLAASPFVGGKNNKFLHAANYLARELGEAVRLIIVATGSQPITAWCDAAGTKGAMWARTVAVLAAAGVSVDAVLWHQGESDAAASGTYAAKFTKLVAELQGANVITSSTPVGVCGLAAQYSSMNSVLAGLTAGRILHVPLWMCQTFDGEHFTGAWLVRAGWQIAKQLSVAFGTSEPEVPVDDFVYAMGASALSIASSAETPVAVQAVGGNASLISGGRFVASKSGLWTFTARGHADGKGTRVKLLDDSGSELAFLAYSGGSEPDGNNPVIGGAETLDLAAGDAVWLGVCQGSGSTRTLSAADMVRWIRLSARFEGQAV